MISNERSFKKIEMPTVELTEDKRTRIREAAIRLFAAKGYHEARADEIAQEAGVAVGTIYNYFKNKDDILLDIFVTEFERSKRFYEQLRRSGLPALEQLKVILQEHFQRLQERGELMQVLLRERFEPSAELKAKLTELYRQMIGYIEGIIHQGIAEGLIRPCNSRIAAHAIFGLIESVIGCVMVYGPREARKLLRDAPQEIAELIWRGIGSGTGKGQ